MLTHIFYLFSLLPVMVEAIHIFEPKKTIALALHKSGEELSKPATVFVFAVLAYLTWMFVGLFTSQWKLFLVLWILSISMSLLKRASGRPVGLYVADGILSTIWIVFIILNKYHLHYNLF